MNLNSKLRSDSVFAQLTNEQLEVLEDWLFEDKLGYKDVLAKAKTEWNINTSATSLGRFYRRLALQRSEERRLETVALCLEGLAAKNDGALQAGLLALANQCAIELLVEQPKSIREFATLLRALTSAGVFEMKHIEFHETRERTKQQALENERKAAAAREEAAREAERWDEVIKKNNAMTQARYEKGLATRKANLAKKAAVEAAAKNAAMAKNQAPKVQVNEPAEAVTPNGAQKTEQVTVEPERRLAAGLPVAEPPKAGTPNTSTVLQQERSEGGTPNRSLLGLEGLIEGVDFTINWAGNPEKPLKTH